MAICGDPSSPVTIVRAAVEESVPLFGTMLHARHKVAHIDIFRVVWEGSAVDFLLPLPAIRVVHAIYDRMVEEICLLAEKQKVVI